MSAHKRRNETPEQKEARLAKLRALPNRSPMHRRAIEDIKDLPRWAKVAIAAHEVLGETWEKAAEGVKRSPKSITDYAACPAGKKWREELRAIADNPKTIAEALLKGTALSVTLDYLMAYQLAIDSGDYKETGVMGRDLLDRIGITKKETKQAQLPSTIVINLPGGTSLDIPAISSEHKRLTAGEDGPTIDAELLDE